MKKVMVVSPHPDDETLGCGGTILKHKKMGDSINWLIITNVASNTEAGSVRQFEIDAVTKNFEFDEVIKLDLPTTKLDTIPEREMIQRVSEVIMKLTPEIVYIPNRSDVHSDHRVVFDTMISATKTFRYPFIKKVLMYEVISETEYSPALQHNAFLPNSFSDITEYLEKKLSILDIYKNEIGFPPFPRSKENLIALATLRGSTAGVRYAEGFVILKEIW